MKDAQRVAEKRGREEIKAVGVGGGRGGWGKKKKKSRPTVGHDARS